MDKELVEKITDLLEPKLVTVLKSQRELAIEWAESIHKLYEDEGYRKIEPVDADFIKTIIKLISDGCHNDHSDCECSLSDASICWKPFAEILAESITTAGYVQQWVKCPNPVCENGILITEDSKGKPPMKCLTCHGRGQVQQYAKLAADQIVPKYELHAPNNERDINEVAKQMYGSGRYNMLKDMTTPDKHPDGTETVWAKIEVGKC